jgi:carboxymethylenebutenolidase
MSDINTGWHEITVEDGTRMRVWVAQPVNARSPVPGLLVFQEAFGVNAHIRDVVERCAREGFAAAAPELFHRTGPGFEGSYDDFPSVQKHTSALTPEGVVADLRAVYAFVQSVPGVEPARIASLGFCMGGRVSYVAAATLPVRAAVSFYGGGIAPAHLDLAARLQVPLLMFWGGLDRHIPIEQIRSVEDALRSAGKAFVNVFISDADHGFFCDARASYNPKAAREAWALTLEFLRQNL